MCGENSETTSYRQNGKYIDNNCIIYCKLTDSSIIKFSVALDKEMYLQVKRNYINYT